MATGLGFGEFAAGLVLLTVVLGTAAATGRIAARRLLPVDAGALVATLGWALCASAALLAAHALPLVAGVLSRAAVVAAGALLLVVVVVITRRSRPVGAQPVPERAAADPSRAGDPERGSASALPMAGGVRIRPDSTGILCAVACALVAGAALAYLRLYVAQPINSSDALNFQIPQVIRWMQSGSLWQLDQFFPNYSNASYPHHGNLLILSVVLPFESTFLVRLVAVPFALLAIFAVAATARELGASRAFSALGAALFGATPVFAKVALDGAQTDAAFLAFAGTGALFLVRHYRLGGRGQLALAALGFGLALGTKWYALTTLPLVGLVWVLALLLGRRSLGASQVVRTVVSLVVGALLAGGLWLVRNAAETGNPLFPQPLGPLPAPADEIRAQAGFTIAHYLGDSAVWREYLLPTFNAFLSAPGYALLAVPLVVLPLAVVISLRGAGAGARLGAAVALIALLLTCGYAVTPYSAFGPEGAPVLAFASVRYALPAAFAGAVVVAWGASRLPRAAGITAALIILAAVGVGVREQYRPAVSWPALLGASALVILLVVAVAAAVTRRGEATSPATAGPSAPSNSVTPDASPWRRAGLACLRPPAVGLIAVALLGTGSALVWDRAREWYGGADPALAWLERNAPADRRIGLTGQWSVAGISPVLPAFGPRLRNEVSYVGPFVEHLLRRPDREASWTALVRQGDYDILVVGLEGSTPEIGWARKAGYFEVATSGRLSVLVRGA